MVVSYDIGVELFVVLFSIFVVFEVGVYFAFLSLPQYYTYNTTLLYTDTTFLFQPTWTENKQINLSTNKTKQPTYLPL